MRGTQCALCDIESGRFQPVGQVAKLPDSLVACSGLSRRFATGPTIVIGGMPSGAGERSHRACIAFWSPAFPTVARIQHFEAIGASFSAPSVNALSRLVSRTSCILSRNTYFPDQMVNAQFTSIHESVIIARYKVGLARTRKLDLSPVV